MASTDAILAGKYPAKHHARRVAEYLRKNNHHQGQGVIYLEAQKTRIVEDDDGEMPFRFAFPFFLLAVHFILLETSLISPRYDQDSVGHSSTSPDAIYPIPM
jgi:hypothetical protein